MNDFSWVGWFERVDNYQQARSPSDMQTLNKSLTMLENAKQQPLGIDIN